VNIHFRRPDLTRHRLAPCNSVQESGTLYQRSMGIGWLYHRPCPNSRRAGTRKKTLGKVSKIEQSEPLEGEMMWENTAWGVGTLACRGSLIN